MKILDSIIVPTLTIAKAGVTGIGIPGVEPAFNGVLELAQMLSTMEANKEDLLDLKKNLGSLTTTIDNLDAGGELKQRLTTLSLELKAMVPECTSLAEKHSLQRFFKSKNYKQTIQDMKSTMESHLYKFTFHGNISIEKIVQDIASNIQVIDRKVDSVNTQVQGIARQTDSVNTREILASLKCVAAHHNAANTPEKCMEGTRVDIIRHLVACLTSTPDSIRVVMLSGVAGSGKSTIAKTVATILAEEQKTLAASFFFSRDHTDREKIDHLATTLAMQLAEYSPGFRTHLMKLLETDGTSICKEQPRLQFQKLVVELLGKLPPCSQPWVICLDALDECGKDRGQIFLRWLSDSMDQIPAHI
ncbi:hypothetical protein DFH08DRAFT_896028 [Mycena albidolilacea]|uniref:NACHT domain-containing protein n=1 Tax=Mycena albidolilacea TaxID=1033008 RepID=A0AAD6Z9N5_9AGAR|nr:hypothetical protein DFH08DRAFT_896028 [Mycena albidolilacea]